MKGMDNDLLRYTCSATGNLHRWTVWVTDSNPVPHYRCLACGDEAALTATEEGRT